MFQPQYVCIATFPDDIVRQLIAIRLKNLNDKNAELAGQYERIEAELHDHEKQYRKSASCFKPNQNQSEAMLESLLLKMELKHFQLPTESRKNNYKRIQFRKKSVNSEMMKSESSPTQKITPYHFTKFRTSLNKFSLACSKENEKLKWNKLKEDPKAETKMREKPKFPQEKKR